MKPSVRKPRRGAPRAGFILMGPMLLATLATLATAVLMTACHSAPVQSSSAASPASVRETPAPGPAGQEAAALVAAGPPAIAPFEEQFYVALPDDDDAP